MVKHCYSVCDGVIYLFIGLVWAPWHCVSYKKNLKNQDKHLLHI